MTPTSIVPFLILACSAIGLSTSAHAAGTQLKWHGHAAFQLTTPKGKVLLIDPWLSNPSNPDKKAVEELKQADFILVTHGHFDHTGDAVAIAKATQARLVANFELGQNMARVLGFPADRMGFDTLGNSGGELKLADGEVTVRFLPAVHSSSLDPAGEQNKNAPIVYGGNPNGFLIRIAGGPTIYHTGDTDYFSDMALLAKEKVDVALINIGGHFGMEAAQAALAATAVKAKLTIPHHFKTFPVLTQDEKPFVEALKKKGLRTKVMTPGETLAL